MGKETAAKLVAAAAGCFILGAMGAQVTNWLSRNDVSPAASAASETRVENPASTTPAAKTAPLFDPALDDCLPTGKAKYLSLDTYPFVIRFPAKPSEDFVTHRPGVFAMGSAKRTGDGVEVELMVDGEPAKIDIPLSRLWAVRFCAADCPSAFSLRIPKREYAIYTTAENVAPCARQDRKDQAELVFSAGFAAMQDGNPMGASPLFEFGVGLDPTSAPAWFYLAENHREMVQVEPEWYRRALEIGLPAELEAIARERMEE